MMPWARHQTRLCLSGQRECLRRQTRHRREYGRPILEAADKTGELDKKALAMLPPMLADQLRAAWAGRAGSGHKLTSRMR
jgi:hypothetical protein